MVTPRPFIFKKTQVSLTDEDMKEGLLQLLSSHRRFNDTYLTEILENYLNSREQLIKTHKGKYVFVTKDSIIPTDKEHIDLKIDTPTDAKSGVFFKVGDELKISGEALYASQLISDRPTLPLTYGERNNPNLWFRDPNVVVDTGLDVTTFDMQVLNTIKQIHPSFANLKHKTIHVIGGTQQVYEGYIDIDFCGTQYTSILVNFSYIPCTALIGRNLINTGKLDYDAQEKWICFTRH